MLFMLMTQTRKEFWVKDVLPQHSNDIWDNLKDKYVLSGAIDSEEVT